MREVKVNRKSLLATVKKNRDEHVATFEEAMKGYRKELAEKLDTALADLLDGKDPNLNVFFHINKPRSHEQDYDRAIQMLEWSQDEVVSLDEESFSHLVQDEWGWKTGFMETTAAYRNA